MSDSKAAALNFLNALEEFQNSLNSIRFKM